MSISANSTGAAVGPRRAAVEIILSGLDNAQPPVAPVIEAAPVGGRQPKRAAPVDRAPVFSAALNSRPSHTGPRTQEVVRTDVDQPGLHRRCADFALTDLGNAERFSARFKGRVRWCAAKGFIVWDGRRWAAEGAEERVRELAHKTVRSIQEEARLLEQEARAIAPPPDDGADGEAGVDA